MGRRNQQKSYRQLSDSPWCRPEVSWIYFKWIREENYPHILTPTRINWWTILFRYQISLILRIEQHSSKVPKNLLIEIMVCPEYEEFIGERIYEEEEEVGFWTPPPYTFWKTLYSLYLVYQVDTGARTATKRHQMWHHIRKQHWRIRFQLYDGNVESFLADLMRRTMLVCRSGHSVLLTIINIWGNDGHTTVCMCAKDCAWCGDYDCHQGVGGADDHGVILSYT